MYFSIFFIISSNYKNGDVCISLSLKFSDNVFSRCSKIKKVVIIVIVTFIALAIVALAISLPIALKNREDASNNSSTNGNTTNSPSGSTKETTVASTYILYLSITKIIENLFIKF